ncbi:hypothetical protein DPMN_086054 [Dreissena polymorpha]|uniref:Uncharacterized protein n=1 Tax=Dreissena polymorpha TaxID=45954 RepID=A0A9D4BKV1_DREPO|nr:hypothetical protein DPMN_086054 [Dreissena polymorpha]
MNQVNWLVKVDMKMEQVLQIFMVDLDLDSKNAIVSGQALHMFLKLRAAECNLKAWNHYRKFLLFSKQRQVSSMLFHTNKARLGVPQDSSSPNIPL